MARRPRTIIAGYPNYIVFLSNKGVPIFRDDSDRENFLNFLKSSRQSTSEKLKIYAYLLMDSLIHIIAMPHREDDISRFVQNLLSRYVRYYNLKYNQSGPLFESRFKNFIIGMDEHLLTAIRYLESMALKKHMTESLEGYGWSSYNFRAYGKDERGILNHDPVYLASGTTEKERQEKYKRIFIEAKKEDEGALERFICKGGIFADEKTKRAIEEALGYKLAPKSVGRPKKDVRDREDVSIKRRHMLRKSLFVLSLLMPDFLIIIATLYLANGITINLRNLLHIRHNPYIVPFDNYRWLPFMITSVVEISFFNLGLCTDLIKLSRHEIFLRAGKAILLMSLILLSLIYMTRSFNISRIFLAIFALISLFVLSMERILLSKILQKYHIKLLL